VRPSVRLCVLLFFRYLPSTFTFPSPLASSSPSLSLSLLFHGLVTDNVYCLVKIIQNDERIIAAVQFEIKLFGFFSTDLNSSLIILIQTYTVNCRNASNRLRVHMNIILHISCISFLFAFTANKLHMSVLISYLFVHLYE